LFVEVADSLGGREEGKWENKSVETAAIEVVDVAIVVPKAPAATKTVAAPSCVAFSPALAASLPLPSFPPALLGPAPLEPEAPGGPPGGPGAAPPRAATAAARFAFFSSLADFPEAAVSLSTFFLG